MGKFLLCHVENFIFMESAIFLLMDFFAHTDPLIYYINTLITLYQQLRINNAEKSCFNQVIHVSAVNTHLLFMLITELHTNYELLN